MTTKITFHFCRGLLILVLLATSPYSHALCTSVKTTELPMVEEPLLSKVAYYIALPENNYRMIRFVSVGSFFNVEYCRQLGRNFSVENYDEFDPDFCEPLSDMWISYSEAEKFHAYFVQNLKVGLKDQEFKNIEHTVIQGILARLDDVAWGTVGGLIVKYVKAHPWSSGRMNALGSRLVRSAGVFMIVTAILGIVADQEAMQQTSADVRSMELKTLLNDHERNNVYLIGPHAKDRAVERIMEVLKESLSKALYDTYAEKCIA